MGRATLEGKPRIVGPKWRVLARLKKLVGPGNWWACVGPAGSRAAGSTSPLTVLATSKAEEHHRCTFLGPLCVASPQALNNSSVVEKKNIFGCIIYTHSARRLATNNLCHRFSLPKFGSHVPTPEAGRHNTKHFFRVHKQRIRERFYLKVGWCGSSNQLKNKGLIK